MKRGYRLSAAERPEIKSISDRLASVIPDRTDANAVYALGDLFLIVATAARQAGNISDEQIAAIRHRIGVKLTYAQRQYTRLEQELLLALGSHSEPVSASKLVSIHYFSRQSLNGVLRSLIDKKAVSIELRGPTGFYRLTETGEAYVRSLPLAAAPGALLRTPGLRG